MFDKVLNAPLKYERRFNLLKYICILNEKKKTKNSVSNTLGRKWDVWKDKYPIKDIKTLI